MKAELIYNPYSGQASVRRELEDVSDYLGRHQWQVNISETSLLTGATELTRRAVSKGADVVIAAGGDGTVNEVANGLVNTRAALGVLPVGTTNSWALQVGIPALNPINPGTRVVKMFAGIEDRIEQALPVNYYRNVLQKAADVLLKGRIVPVDAGIIGSRYFLMWAGIGLDAAVVENISSREKKALGSWAYVLNAVGSGYRYTNSQVSLKLDGKKMSVNTPLIVVSNIRLYGGVMAIGAKACVNDGLLDVCIFKGSGFFSFARHALKVLLRRHLRDPKIEYYQCSEINVEPSPSLPIHVDGEAFGKTPVLIKVAPRSIRAILPKDLPENLLA